MLEGPKNYIKKRFNVAKWAGVDQVKHNASLIKKLATNEADVETKVSKKQTRKMSFEELMQANQWTEADIKKNIRYQIRMSYGFLAFSGVLLLIAFYLFSVGNWFGGLFSLVFMCLGLAYAYQAWVSSEQLKQRKIRIAVKASFFALFKKTKA
jgi:VIT1/CCC1 family predicted Fe2+/Mn2+ transporter